MTSLTPTLSQPPHDTPAVYTLAPDQPVFAADVPLHECEALADVMEDLVWQRHWRAVRLLPQQTRR